MSQKGKFLVLLNIFIITAYAFITPLWAILINHIGANITTAGNAIGIFSIIIGVFTYLFARLENKVNNNELFLVISALIISIGYLGYFILKHPWQLYTIQAILGIGSAMQAPAIYALYGDSMQGKNTTTGWGLWTAVFNIAMGLGAFISAYLYHHGGFTIVFSSLFSLSIVSLLLSLHLYLKK